MDGIVTIACRWRGQSYPLPFTAEEFSIGTLRDLKQVIQEQFCIPADRQKFLGIRVKDAPSTSRPDDETGLNICEFTANDFILVGTPEAEQLPQERLEERALEEDLEMSLEVYNSVDAQKLAVSCLSDSTNRLRLRLALERLDLRYIRQPRVGKKLLVLDIDYTIYDCRGASQGYSMEFLARPYLMEFLHMVWPAFDFAFWSQTRWQWVEIKLTSLGLLAHPEYGPVFALNKSTMINCKLPSKRSEPAVKAMTLIWEKSNGRWGPHNSLQIDDLPRNFILNPANGVRVSPYTVDQRATDRELLALGEYLMRCVAHLEDVSILDHSAWKGSLTKKVRK